MSILATKCGIQNGDSLAVVIEKVRSRVDAVLVGSSLPHRADQALMALDGIVAVDKISTIKAAHAAFIEHYGEGAVQALDRVHRRWDA